MEPWNTILLALSCFCIGGYVGLRLGRRDLELASAKLAEYWQHHGHSLDGSSIGSIRYREWLLRQTPALQDWILGKDKANEFRKVTPWA